jgi:tetratricopeptide (TPR) repeat protein
MTAARVRRNIFDERINQRRKEINMNRTMFALLLAATGFTPIAARSQGAAPAAGGASTSSPFKKDLERGYRLKEQKRGPEAVAAFAAVLAKDPSNHAALTELGYLHAGLRHYNTALKYLRAASAQDPDNMRLRMDLGYAAQSAKRYDAATEQFRIVAERRGEFQAQAQAALETMKASSPAAGEADVKQRRLREQGYAALSRGDKTAAGKSFESAVANDPKDAAALKQLGFIDLDQGRLAEAAANFEAVRALEPNDYFVALQLGYTYERLQKKEQARESFSAALASADEKIHGAAQTALRSYGAPAAGAPASSL